MATALSPFTANGEFLVDLQGLVRHAVCEAPDRLLHTRSMDYVPNGAEQAVHAVEVEARHEREEIASRLDPRRRSKHGFDGGEGSARTDPRTSA